jgi:dTDP-4-dehydrorhamnose 3,5-epimerase-like enzyme
MSAILDNIKGMNSSTSVAVLDGQTLTEEEFVRDFVKQSRPCVVRSAVTHWPAVKKWQSGQYLADRCGKYPVTMWFHNNFVARRRHDEHMKERRNLSFSQAVELLNSASTGVASLGALEVKANGDFAELLDDIGTFPFLEAPPDPLLYPTSRYFVYRNAGTGWHYHPTDESLMCQIVGSKKIGLLEDERKQFPTVSKAFLEEHYYESECSFNSPECGDLKWFSAELHEGDALYIPPTWWHGVIPTSDSLGVTATMCWRSPIGLIGNISRPTQRKLWAMLIQRIRRSGLDRRWLRICIFLVASLPAQAVKTLRFRKTA